MSADAFTAICAIGCLAGLAGTWALAYLWPDIPTDDDELHDIDNTPLGVLDLRDPLDEHYRTAPKETR
ncbi:hypothetical protein [Gordonia sp. NPDC003376]